MWLVLLLFACAPKPAPAASLDAVALPPPHADNAQQGVLDTLAKTLAEQQANTGVAAYGQGAALARSLEDGVADPQVVQTSIDLLHWLATTDLALPPAPETNADTAAGVHADDRATAETVDTRVAEARDRLRRGDYQAAIEVLKPLKGGPRWADAEPYWEEAVDGWVYEERERAGHLFVGALKMKGAARHQALMQVHGILAGLLRDYPDSAYTKPLNEDLERVERSLETEPPVP